jgi:hypothetical protein
MTDSPAAPRSSDFNRARDEILMRGDVLALVAFAKFHGKPVPDSYEVAEIAMHQAITATLSLPVDYRCKSKRWLEERGYQSLDDGKLVGGDNDDRAGVRDAVRGSDKGGDSIG